MALENEDSGEIYVATKVEEPEFLEPYRAVVSEVCGRLSEEIEQFSTVEDVAKAEPRIKAAVETMTQALESVIEAWKHLSPEEQMKAGGVSVILEDPEVVRQLELVEDMLMELRERDEKVMEAFQEIGLKYSQRYEELMDWLMDQDERDEY